MSPEERARWALDLIPVMEASRRRHVTAAILESLRQAYADGWSARGRVDAALTEERLLTSRTVATPGETIALIKRAINDAASILDGEALRM